MNSRCQKFTLKRAAGLIVPILTGCYTFVASADTAPVELLRDVTFSSGFTFGMPERVESYRLAGKEISNAGISTISNEPYLSLSEEDDGLWIAGSNRLGRSTDAPVWVVQGYFGSTTPYSRANDYFNGLPLGGDDGCPDLVTVSGGCLWEGKSTSASSSQLLMSLASGRGAVGRDADLKYRINEIESYTTWDLDKYWGNCTSVGAGGTAYDPDGVCNHMGGRNNFQTASTAGVPGYFSGGGRNQTELPINQIIVGDTNLENISTLVFSGSMKLERTRKDFTSDGVHICSSAEMQDGRWEAFYSRYINCYVRLKMDKDGVVPLAGTNGYTPPDMAVFDLGIGLVNKKKNSQIWIGVINSVDWRPDVIQVDSGTYSTNACSINDSEDFFSPFSWSCILSYDPASGFYAKLPSFVFYNTPSSSYPPVIQINPGTKQVLDDSNPSNVISTWNTNNEHDSGWISFSTQYEVDGSQIDLIPWIQSLLNTAHAHNSEISADINDYRINRLGISLEQGGPVDTEVSLKDLSLKATYKVDSTLSNTASVISGFIK